MAWGGAILKLHFGSAQDFLFFFAEADGGADVVEGVRRFMIPLWGCHGRGVEIHTSGVPAMP